MSEIPEGFLYTEEHEYLKPGEEDGTFYVGVTDYAQGELGDVVYLALPTVGSAFDRMEAFGSIEAVKAVNDLFCPVGGEVLEVNVGLDAEPVLVNSDPYGQGWLLELSVSRLKISKDDTFGLLLATCADCMGKVEVVRDDS